MIDQIYWQRQRLLKQEIDSLSSRVTALEWSMRLRIKPRRSRLKRLTDIFNMVSTAHTLWPTLIAMAGFVWKLVMKLFY